MRRSISVGLVFVMLLSACSDDDDATTSTLESSTTVPPTSTTTTAPDPRTPVILDYSPTVSDIGALAFVASHPDLRLVAVTLPGTGESYCEFGVPHTRGTLELFGLGGVPVACGPEDPITGWNAFPTSWRVGSNEMDLPEAEPNDTRSAPELIVDLLSQTEVPIEILAVGPLTNIALALEAAPETISSIGGITIMGGAVDVPGNVFRNEVGEWNVWVDPTAAGVVFASGAPVTLVPLDATNDLPANSIFFSALDAAADTPAATLVRDLIEVDEFWLAGGFFFWDELAAVVLVDESIVQFETRTLVVDDTERENKGWTREDPSGTEIRVAVSVDRVAFEQLYLDTLVGVPTDLGYIEATGRDRAYFAALEEITRRFNERFEEVAQQVADDLGLDLESEEAFAPVMTEAIPLMLDGPWVERTDALAALTPPEGLEEAHAAWIKASLSFPEVEAELITGFLADDWSVVAPLFAALEEACEPIRAGADLRLLDVVFDCF